MTNETNGMDVQAITKAVAEFNDQHTPAMVVEIDLVNKAQESRTEQAYRFAAGLLELALLIRPAKATAPLIQFLSDRKQSFAKAGDNPYAPFIRAVFSVQVGDKWTVDPKHKSFAKYANIVRLLVKYHDEGRIGKDVVGYIRNFTWNERKALGALEAKDRHDSPNATATKRVDDIRDIGLKATVVDRIDQTFGHNEGDIVTLWGRISDGKLEVMEALVSNDDRDSLYYQLGQKLKPKKAA